MRLVNGERSDQLSTADRGLLYGQSLFETIVVEDKQPLLLTRHLQRLEHGCVTLDIPFQEQTLVDEVLKVASSVENAVLRVTVTMGEGNAGERGYVNPTKPEPTRIVAAYPLPVLPAEYRQQGVNVGVAEIRLAVQPRLAGLKHGNRLEQIIARSEWQPDWQEALMLDHNEHVIEGTQTNVIIRNGDLLSTPKLDQCGVQGVMRDCVLELAADAGYSTAERTIDLHEVTQADEVLLTNSVIGIWPVRQVQNVTFKAFSASQQLLNLLRQYGAISTI